MATASRWYDEIQAQDRPAVNAVADWLRPVQWQWFVTATFSWSVKSETADRKLEEWINLVERDLKARICIVAGKERKARAHGTQVPWHFHVLVTALKQVPDTLLENHWKRVAGEGKKRIADGELVDEGILVEAYEAHRKGPEYCLKAMNECDGGWDSRWLRMFHPDIKGTSRPSHRSQRQARRFKWEKRCVAPGFDSARISGTIEL